MNGESKGSKIKEIMVIDDPDAIKLMFKDRFIEIIEILQARESSVSELAKALGVNPGSIHYYLKEMERLGLAIQVREEVKGNIVKKYYRATARNFYLDGSRFNVASPGDINPMEDFIDRLMGTITHFGYDLPDERSEALKASLLKYDRRKKEILREIQQAGLENVEQDGQVVSDAYHVAIILREIEDEELNAVRNEIRELLTDARGH
ncbi:ArsR family transcriptional regulator [Methanocella sp. CWC-04]|uniref:ArsR family transcriptional regulator n=2 Tax=Methanooceanicella nereidis TaxID=2052831 RepID=A0AAP2RE87_9EURY|nr:ArsR family transcriptional regulator [Methanocella sp. CWC-04]